MNDFLDWIVVFWCAFMIFLGFRIHFYRQKFEQYLQNKYPGNTKVSLGRIGYNLQPDVVVKIFSNDELRLNDEYLTEVKHKLRRLIIILPNSLFILVLNVSLFSYPNTLFWTVLVILIVSLNFSKVIADKYKRELYDFFIGKNFLLQLNMPAKYPTSYKIEERRQHRKDMNRFLKGAGLLVKSFPQIRHTYIKYMVAKWAGIVAIFSLILVLCLYSAMIWIN